MNSPHSLTIVEAVEALSTIVDLPVEKEIGILQKHQMKHGVNQITYKTIEWLDQEHLEDGMQAVKEVFGTVFNYLETFFRQDQEKDFKSLSGVKSIMLLVGEAAKKIDKYSHLFHESNFKSITETDEFQKLQDFYQRKIAHTVDENTLGKWILGIAQQVWEKQSQIKSVTPTVIETDHVFIDLESVKNDSDYELFFIRKADGSRFFSPRLVRNIKLVSDFGSLIGSPKKADLLSDLSIWKDRYVHQVAKEIYKRCQSDLDQFFSVAYKDRDNELTDILSKAIFALMLATNPQNLMSNQGKKSSIQYFYDFMLFFREALRSREYELLLAYPPQKENGVGESLLNTIQTLSEELFHNKNSLETLQPLVRQLLDEGRNIISPDHHGESKTLWSRLAGSWQALAKVMKTHPNGPLGKVMESIENGEYNVFEPLNYLNIPNEIFSYYLPNKRVAILRIPCPTRQESTESAAILAEFKAFLNSGRKHLIVVMQDRTSWKECARAFALEGLSSKNALITLPTDSEFYQQITPYNEENRWDRFSSHLLDQAGDEQSGYYISANLREKIDLFIPKAIEGIHSLFFQNKNVLTKEERLCFIDLFYLFLSLKAVDISQPDSMSYICKDGLDTGNLFSCFMWAFFQILPQEGLQEFKVEHLEAQLFGPVLINRERVPLTERFQRIIRSLKHIEGVKEDLGSERYEMLVRQTMRILYEHPIADSHVQ